MKITSVDVIKLKRLDFSAQTPVLCRINTDEGIYGYGEAGVSIMDFSVGSYELIKLMSPMLIGKDPLYTDAIYEMLAGTFWAQGNGGVIMAAISAIDTALWDIKGKYFNVPCYVLLGGKHRDKLRAYASQLQNGWKYHNFLSAPGDLAFLKEACQAALDDGYDAIKIDFLGKRLDGSRIAGGTSGPMRNYITKDLMKDFMARVECARETVGPDIDIIMENHNITNATTALQFAREAEPYDIMFLEEPASPMSVLEYERLAAGTSIPLATGERTYTRLGFLPLIENGSLSVVQPDLGNCGGITEGRKICDLANTFGVSVQTHTCNTPISVAASLQLEAAIPNFIIHEHHTVNTLKEVTELCVHDYQPVGGYFGIPDLPGIGNELSEKALAEAQAIETVR